MQGVGRTKIKIIIYFIADVLGLPIDQILIMDVVNDLKIVRSRRKIRSMKTNPFRAKGVGFQVGQKLHTSVDIRLKSVGGFDDDSTGPAINQSHVTNTGLFGSRTFRNESQQTTSVDSPTGKVAKNPVGPHYESKVFFDKSLRSPDLLHAKDINKFDLFMQILKFFAKKGLIPAKE